MGTKENVVAKSGKMVTKSITRSDVRSATVNGYKLVRSDPKSMRITPGQRDHLAKKANSKPHG